MEHAFKIIIPEFFLINNELRVNWWGLIHAYRLALLKTTMLFVGFKVGINVGVEIKHLLLMICYQNQIVTHHVAPKKQWCVEQEWKITSIRNQVECCFSRTVLKFELLRILWWEAQVSCGPRWTFSRESSDNNCKTWTNFQQLATPVVCVGSKMSSNIWQCQD